MKNTIIVDIDWTVADHSHRLHHITGKVKDWPRYNALAKDDTPIAPVILVVELLFRTHAARLDRNINIIFITGRKEELMYDTIERIGKHIPIGNYTLRMRWQDDNREDTVLKKEIFDNLWVPVENIIAVFEDRPRVCKMRRDLWLYVFNCDQSGKRF